MAGTVTSTLRGVGNIRSITLAIVADASDGSIPDTILPSLEGRLLAIETKPGTTAPTSLYDVTIADALGHDVLEGVGMNRSATVVEKAPIVYSTTSIHPVVTPSDVLTMSVANNSVHSAGITVVLYFALGG
jgi:hypothetical protein